jgi:outer membrane protein TolC
VEVGEGLQQDVLLAQLELSKLLDTEIRLTGAIDKAKAQLNALLDRPANQAFKIPVQIQENLPR